MSYSAYMIDESVVTSMPSSLDESFSSVSHLVVSDSLRPHELQHARPLCPSPTPRVHSNSCASSRWCHPVISSSVVLFSSCPQSLPASLHNVSIFTAQMISPSVWLKFTYLIVKLYIWDDSVCPCPLWLFLDFKKWLGVIKNLSIIRTTPY